MIRNLPPEILRIRSRFFRDIREFFFSRDYIEVETPLLNPTGGMDPFLDPVMVQRRGVRKSVQAGMSSREGYLITSPEYNLKIILSKYPHNVFQIAHGFREGDSGDLHTEEFLLLEWYRVNADEFDLMAECHELLVFLASREYSRRTLASNPLPVRHSVRDLFERYCHCGLSRRDLEKAVTGRRLLSSSEHPSDLRYDELFFTLFLNQIESRLGREGPEFIYHYPAELAALAIIEGEIGRRFELFWEGIELANGYHELTCREEQEERFRKENELRVKLGKPVMEFDEQFLTALENDFPPLSGIALGVERLLMLLLGEEKLAAVSPFF